MKLAAGHPVRHFERIDSTNAEARRLAEEGEQGPLWIIADEQTMGRGRIGRNWVSDPGNLHATFLFAAEVEPMNATQVTFVAALAVHDAVTALRPALDATIKWPNDLLAGQAKFCGILSEIAGTNPTRIAMGCGINLASAPRNTAYPAMALGGDLQPLTMLRELDAALSSRLKAWNAGRGFAAIRAAWEAKAFGIGGEVQARSGNDNLSGTFIGLAPDGAMCIRMQDNSEKLIHAGEVSFAGLERLRQKP